MDLLLAGKLKNKTVKHVLNSTSKGVCAKYEAESCTAFSDKQRTKAGECAFENGRCSSTVYVVGRDYDKLSLTFAQILLCIIKFGS